MTWRVSEIDVDGWYWWICLAVVSFLARLSTPWGRGPCVIRKLLFFFFFALFFCLILSFSILISIIDTI